MVAAEHDAFWTARTAGGNSAGTRALIEVLLLHAPCPARPVLAGITATLAQLRPDPAMVAVEARRHLEPAHPRLTGTARRTQPHRLLRRGPAARAPQPPCRTSTGRLGIARWSCWNRTISSRA